MANLSVERPDAPVEYPDECEHPVDVPTNRRDTLLARAREEDEEVEVLSTDEFKELLKTPNTLYSEIIKLITKTKTLYANCENYRQQLHEAKLELKESQIALQKSEAIVDRLLMQPAPVADRLPSASPGFEGNRHTAKLPDPPIFDGKAGDGPTFDN